MMLRPAGDSSTDDDEDIEGFSIPKFNQVCNLIYLFRIL